MATPPPIYISSPGLLLSKNPATTQVVLLPPASTIGSQVIVRDAAGTASATYPIVISTTHGALFKNDQSTFYITDPYAAFAAAALRPTLYTPLYASSFVPTTRYGTESNFTPQFQYISSAFTAAEFQALNATTLQGTLINGAPQFTIPTPFSPASLSTTAVSTAQVSVAGPYTAGNIQTTNSYSDYLSAGLGVFSTVTANDLVITGSATLQSTLRTAGSFAVTGNAALAGSATFADVSANGYWSTLGTIGIGGDVSGYAFLVGGSVTTGATVYARDAVYVSTGSVGTSLSTVLGYASTAVYSAGLGVGVTPGTALGATLDVSGGGSVSGWLTASGISTFTLSTGTAVVSSATLRDINTPYSAYDLKVQGGQLFVGGSAVGGGGGAVSAEFLGNTFTASNYLYGTSSIVSTFTVGSNIVNPDFNMAVYGDAHSSTLIGDTRRSTLWVAVGTCARADLNLPRAVTSSIKYSWNGSNNWSNAVTGGFTIGQDVAWNGKMWVAVGTVYRPSLSNSGDPRSTIQWSLDGSNWSNVTAGGGFTGVSGGWGIAWNGKMWIATGHCDTFANIKSSIQYSFDGSNFRAVNSVNNFIDGGATYSNVVFRPHWNGCMWLAGKSSGSNGNNACYSYDGLNWSNSTISTITGPVSTTNWNGRYWIAGGSGLAVNNYRPSIAISSNGFNWVSSINANFGGSFGTINGRGHVHRTLWTGDKWVAIGLNSTTTIQYSFDGLNWFDSSSTTPTRTYVFDKFQVNDANTQLTYYLARPISSNDYNYFGGGRGLAWNGKMFVATGYIDGGAVGLNQSTIRYSLNLVDWFTPTNNDGFYDSGLGFGNGSANNNGNAVAWQSNCQTDISLPNQDFITSYTQQTYQSTAQIYSLSSLVTFNQTLFVDSTRQTAINSLYSSISTHYMLYVDGSMFTNGAAKLGGSASWTAVSDERVKQDIQDADLSACYHTVRNLHVHNYKFKDEYITKYKLSSKPRYGLYAEEVERVLPEAVIDTDVLGENIKMLDMEPVYMMHYGATSYLYSTLQHRTSTIAGGHTYITAAGPLQDIVNHINSNATYTNIPSLMENLNYITAAHQSNYQ